MIQALIEGVVHVHDLADADVVRHLMNQRPYINETLEIRRDVTVSKIGDEIGYLAVCVRALPRHHVHPHVRVSPSDLPHKELNLAPRLSDLLSVVNGALAWRQGR